MTLVYVFDIENADWYACGPIFCRFLHLRNVSIYDPVLWLIPYNDNSEQCKVRKIVVQRTFIGFTCILLVFPHW